METKTVKAEDIAGKLNDCVGQLSDGDTHMRSIIQSVTAMHKSIEQTYRNLEQIAQMLGIEKDGSI
jgi:hypothetical protein